MNIDKIIEKSNHKGIIQKTRNFIKRNFLRVSLSSLLVFNALSYATRAEAWPWQKGFVREVSNGYEIEYENLTSFRERKNEFFRAVARVDEPRVPNPNYRGEYTSFFADYGDQWAIFNLLSNKIRLRKRIRPGDGIPECFIVPVPKKNCRDYKYLKESLEKYHIFIDDDFMNLRRKTGRNIHLYSIYPKYEAECEWEEIKKGLYHTVSKDADVLKVGSWNIDRDGAVEGDTGYWIVSKGFRIEKGEKEINILSLGRGGNVETEHFKNLDQYFR